VRAEDTVRESLLWIGEDPTREGLLDTPSRVARMWEEFFTYKKPPPKLTQFATKQDGIHYDELIIVKDIPFYSLCEHHAVPFFGMAHVGYLPNEHVVGLSKIVRVVKHFAHRLQVQERLTTQVADYLMEGLAPQGVCVLIEARHLCMEMRGVETPGAMTSTHAIRGTIDKDEFLTLVRIPRRPA